MKMILKFTTLAAVIILFALGCQKTSLLDDSGNVISGKEFNATTAKLWYYKYFVNSANAKSIGNDKKVPIWKNEIYHKVGKLEIIEFPLIMDKKQIPVPSGLSLNNKIRIAAATLSKIKFTKNDNGEIFVTQVTYIPDMVYLQSKKFDISNSGYGNTTDDFTGIMIIRKWNGKLLSTNVVANGKIIGKKSAVKNSVAGKGGNNEPDASFVEVQCSAGSIEMCMIQQDCWVEPDGMVHSCTGWYLVSGSCFCEEIEGGGDGGEDYCELYGYGCDDGEDDPPPPPPSGCDPTATYPEEQNFNSHITMESATTVSYYANNTPINPNPIIGTINWIVAKAAIAGWTIKANTQYSYYHNERVYNSITNAFEERFDLFNYQTVGSYSEGTNVAITSTWTQVGNPQDQVFNNNTANTSGVSMVQGTVRHVLNIAVRIPFCQPLTLDQTITISPNTLNFFPK